MHRCSFGRRVTAVFTTLAFSMVPLGPAPARAAGKLKIMTATTDLAALAEEVGGEKIEAESIARGYQDPHFVDAKPSFLLKLKRADLLIVVGLELEIGRRYRWPRRDISMLRASQGFWKFRPGK